MSFQDNIMNKQDSGITVASGLSGQEQETLAPFCYWFEEGIQMDRRAAAEETSNAPVVTRLLVAVASAT